MILNHGNLEKGEGKKPPKKKELAESTANSSLGRLSSHFFFFFFNKPHKKSYLMSGSSFSSLLGGSFRLLFLARGQPDKLDTEIITCQTSDKFSRAHACMKKIRLFGCVEASKSCHSRVETRPRSCQSQNVTCISSFIYLHGKKKEKCDMPGLCRTLLPSVGCIVSCNVT